MAAQQRRPTTISFRDLTRRNFSRTSAGEAITTLSPRDNVAQASRLPSDEFDGGVAGFICTFPLEFNSANPTIGA